MKKILFSIVITTILNATTTYKEVKELEQSQGTLKALPYYKELAQKNNPDAIYELALIHSQGKYFKKNINKTHNLLKKASNLDHDKSSYYLGKLYLSKKSPYFSLEKAYNSFVKAANNNHAPALNMIGQFFVKGIVVDKDYVQALKLFERASKQDYIKAQCNLAFMYANGKGTLQNLGRAHSFAKQGKEKGYKRCIKIWKEFNLHKYTKDGGWKFNFYTKPE